MTSDIQPHRMSDLDKRILKRADYMSPEQISEELNGALSPARVRLRIEELIGGSDWLSDAKQEQLVLLRLRKLLAEIEDMVGADISLDHKKMQLQTLKEIGLRIDKRRAATEIDLNTYDVNVGRTMARVMDIGMSFMKGALRNEVDPLRWDSLMIEALAHAQAEIEKNQAVEA